MIKNMELESKGMKLKDFWKKKVFQVLKNMYGDGLNDEKTNQFLDSLIAKSHNPIAQMRNIYTEKYWKIELNDILEIVDNEQLIIGANGTFTYRQNVKTSELLELLTKWLKERSVMKKKAIECDGTGDVAGRMKYDNLQNAKKEYTNSAYGVSAMNGFILYSPDSASMITSQGRELISEILWTLEKFLGSNMAFKTYNEFYSYINETIKAPIDKDMILKYNIKIPSFRMLSKRLGELLSYLPEVEKKDVDNSKSLFLLLKNISKDPFKSIKFYYKSNLYEFLNHNPKVMEIVDWIMLQGKTFNSPIPEIMEGEESKIYIKPIRELIDIFLNFVILLSPTYDRVDKYQTRERKEVILSDTDSVVCRLDEWIEFVNEKGKVKFDPFYDNKNTNRAANIMNFICTEICNIMGQNMAKNCYVPDEYCKRVKLKNEFFFKSLIIYPNIKKNYSAYQVLREGVVVNKVANTGLALTGSNVNPFVKKNMEDIIFEEIHSVRDISITRIMERVYKLEADIRHKMVEEQDISFGKYSSYKNTHGRANPWSDSLVRAVELWNHLYPDEKIETYNKVYILNTVLEREDQLHLIKDPNIREFVRDKIFKNPVDPKAMKYGLRSIAIPEGRTKYPKWIKDIVDVDKLTEAHVNSLTSLLPSLGLYINRVKSNRNHLSPLISL